MLNAKPMSSCWHKGFMINDTVSFYVKRNKKWKNKVCTFRKNEISIVLWNNKLRYEHFILSESTSGWLLN